MFSDLSKARFQKDVVTDAHSAVTAALCKENPKSSPEAVREIMNSFFKRNFGSSGVCEKNNVSLFREGKRPSEKLQSTSAVLWKRPSDKDFHGINGFPPLTRVPPFIRESPCLRSFPKCNLVMTGFGKEMFHFLSEANHDFTGGGSS
jgi:hypothetical protein